MSAFLRKHSSLTVINIYLLLVNKKFTNDAFMPQAIYKQNY